MKRITVLLMTILLSFSLVPSYATLETTPTTATTTSSSSTTTTTTTTTSSDATTANSGAKAASQVLISRLDEIKAMDKTNMSSADKRVLRKEVKSIRKTLRYEHGGIYLSLGAIIIIVLLLIILL